MTKRAVLYARVSKDDRDNATSSIDGQLADCRAYAESMGYEIVGEYYEDRNKQTSGADWLPEINNILQLAQSGAFDILIAWKLDRIARNRFKQLSIKNMLKYAGVTVEYARERYDDTPAGRMVEGIMGEFAEFQREDIIERLVLGTRRSVAAGNVKFSNVVTFGYDVVKEGNLRTLAINENEAAVVRLIFDLYVNHQRTIYAIANYLDEHKVQKPVSQAKGWSHGTLNNILRNETYAGRWYYGKTESQKDPTTEKVRRVARPKSEWQLVPVPPIVSDAIFEAAQKMRASNKTRGKYRVNVYALGGLLTCGRCGHGMAGITRNDRGGKQFYVCNLKHGKGRYTTAEPCKSPHFTMAAVDGAVWAWVKSIILDPDELQSELEKFQGQQKEAVQPFLGMIEANEAKIAELGKEKDRLIKAYAAGVLSLDDIALQKVDIERRLAGMKEATEQLRAELQPKLLSAAEIETITEIGRQIREEVDFADNDPETQQVIYRMLDLRLTLLEEDGQQWGDVSCVLGRARVSTTYKPTILPGISPRPIPSS